MTKLRYSCTSLFYKLLTQVSQPQHNQFEISHHLPPYKETKIIIRAVIKRRGPGISPSYYEHGRRKIEPTGIPSCLIPHLLVVFTRQLEILVTALIIINTNEIPGELSCLHVWKDQHCYGFIIICAFCCKNLFQLNSLAFRWCLLKKLIEHNKYY